MSDAFQEATDELLTAVESWPAHQDLDEVRTRGGQVLELAGAASPGPVRQAARRIAAALPDQDPLLGGLLALMLGALVESGQVPAGQVGQAVLERTEAVLTAAARFRALADGLVPEDIKARLEAAACDHDHDHDHDDFEDEDDFADGHEDEHDHDQAAEEGWSVAERWKDDDEGEGEGEEHDHGHEHDHDHRLSEEEEEAVEAAYTAAGAQDPDGAAAWEGLEQWSRPAIALLTRDGELRAQARQRPALRDAARALADVGVDFLRRLLDVSPEHELCVLHPPTSQGYRVRARGVVDNFQLHALLAELLVREDGQGPAQGLPGRRPHPEVAAVFRGEGPQEIERHCEGVWNFYAWTALAPDGTLPDEIALEHWVWGEGTPDDVLPFEGQPTLVLGPPSYARSWPAARTFDALPASLELLEVLEPARVHEALARMGCAPRPQPQD